MATAVSAQRGADTVRFVALDRHHAGIQQELETTFTRLLGSSAFTLGAELEHFEADFAEYCGAAHCVGVSSGTAALSLLFRAHGIGPGDEVIVPGHTFIASALAVAHVGATPVLCEVDRATGLIDPEAARAAVSERTAAVLAVHLYGQACDMAAIESFAKPRGLLVFEDAAQAHGATYRDRRVGSLGSGAAFSFYPTKNLGALGDGGAICTDDELIAERLRRLRNLGQRTKGEHVELGYNERLDGLQAALSCASSSGTWTTGTTRVVRTRPDTASCCLQAPSSWASATIAPASSTCSRLDSTTATGWPRFCASTGSSRRCITRRRCTGTRHGSSTRCFTAICRSPRTGQHVSCRCRCTRISRVRRSSGWPRRSTPRSRRRASANPRPVSPGRERANYARGVTDHHCIVRHVLSYHGAGTDHCPLANCEPGQDHRAGADRRAAADGRDRAFERLTAAREWVIGERRLGPDEDVVLDPKAVPQKHPGFDRDPIADDHVVLDVGVIADVAVVPDHCSGHHVRERPYPGARADRVAFD